MINTLSMGFVENGRKQKARQHCGARRSHGRGFCRSTVLGPNGRCRMHGGWSIGPTTDEGRARSLRALAAINEAKRMSKRYVSSADRQRQVGYGFVGSKPKVDRNSILPTFAPREVAAPADPHPALKEDLKAVLREVGPGNYAYATAREFAVGKYSGRRRRRAYAEM